jgi:hypothetical protein
MKRTLMGMAILPFLAGTALAGQPLTDKQMDKVTAGHDLQALELTNSTFVSIGIQAPTLAPTPPAGSTAIVVGAVTLPLANMQVVWGTISMTPPPTSP